MKERPILFSGPMVRALLAGTKTQTRRAIRGEALRWLSTGVEFDASFVALPENGLCPYGHPGDRLWVRETWQHEDGSCEDHRCGNPDHIFYMATDPAPETFASKRPSIFMPRWASRISLEVTAVRVQRVQEITEQDVAAEGVSAETLIAAGPVKSGDDSPRGLFGGRWDSLNAERGFGWAANPWVWAITFRRVP